MHKIISAAFTCIVIIFAIITASSAENYLSADDVLDSTELFPGPPNEDSILFTFDKKQYEEGLKLRHTARGDSATLDADLKIINKVFSEPFGYPITPEETPAIYKIIVRVGRECRRATHAAKRKFSRIRPYVFYKTSTCYSKDEDILKNTGSFPSGHSSNGWGIALILAEINPDRKEAIFKKGYEYGQSRVICGYHWQSDVDAGRIIASACVAMLHANPLFIDDLNKAKEEFAKFRNH